MILNVVTCLREFAQFLTRYSLNFHTDFLTPHPILVICEKIDVNMKTNAHICITKKTLSGVNKHFRYDLMNGMLLLRCENQGYHMLIPIPNSTY